MAGLAPKSVIVDHPFFFVLRDVPASWTRPRRRSEEEYDRGVSFTFSPKNGRALTLPLRTSTLLLNALETAGALDDARPPRAPKSGGAAARAKWLATPSKQPDKLPSYKLSSNDGWIVSPEECLVVARALESLLADEESLELLRDILDAPRSSDKAMRALLKEFAAFNARAAKSGGYTVD